MINPWLYLKQKWEDLNENVKLKTVEILHTVLTYLFNSILLSVPLSIYFSLKGMPLLKMYGLCVICLWILLPFIEHYYVWFREKWKDEVKP